MTAARAEVQAACVAGAHHLVGDAVAAARRALARWDDVLKSENVHAGRFPFVIPEAVLAPHRPHLRPDVRPTSVSDGRSSRTKGALPMAGGALQALPFLHRTIRAQRQVPRGVYTSDFAFSPFPDRPLALGHEDVVCINGVDVRAAGTAGRARTLVERGFEAMGIRNRVTEEPWWFTTPAVVFRGAAGEVLAIVQQSPVHSLLRLIGVDNTRTDAAVEFFYVSERCLLHEYFIDERA